MFSLEFGRESQPQHLKRRFFLKKKPIYFRINSTSVIIRVKFNQLGFSSTEINKPLRVPVHSVLQIRIKVKSQFKLLLKIRCLIILRTESSIISIDSNITDNIIRKVINVQQEKRTTKNGTLRNSNINWIFLRRLPIQNHLKSSITKKRRNKDQISDLELHKT